MNRVVATRRGGPVHDGRRLHGGTDPQSRFAGALFVSVPLTSMPGVQGSAVAKSISPRARTGSTTTPDRNTTAEVSRFALTRNNDAALNLLWPLQMVDAPLDQFPLVRNVAAWLEQC